MQGATLYEHSSTLSEQGYESLVETKHSSAFDRKILAYRVLAAAEGILVQR